jgi:hypothetical protein
LGSFSSSLPFFLLDGSWEVFRFAAARPARLLAERLLPEGYEDYSDGLESMIAWMLSPKKVEHLPAWTGFEDFGF